MAMLAGLALLLSGCQVDPGQGDERAADPVPASPDPTPAGESEEGPDPAEVVAAQDARLMAVRVRRSGRGYRIESVWRPLNRNRPTVRSTARPGGPVRYRLISQRELIDLDRQPLDGPDRRCRPVASDSVCVERSGAGDPMIAFTAGGGPLRRPDTALPVDLILDPVASLDPDTLAVVGGGDGATLFPFQHVTLSHDGGGSWQQHDLPTFDGERAYTAGQVVLPDGRLLAALTSFSDDGRVREPAADRVHGLWVTTDEDWTTFEPFRAAGWPAAEPGTHVDWMQLGVTAGRHPLVWVVVGSRTLYVSDDGGAGFESFDLQAVAAGA